MYSSRQIIRILVRVITPNDLDLKKDLASLERLRFKLRLVLRILLSMHKATIAIKNKKKNKKLIATFLVFEHKQTI